MPQVNTVVWNIECLGGNFGATWRGFQGRPALAQLIANTAYNTDADIILIQELMSTGAELLKQIQQMLNNLPAPQNNWYYDYVKAAVRRNTSNPRPNYPFADSTDLQWGTHNEGYAVFWNQNIAKFIVSAAPPILGNDNQSVANTQSEGVRMQAAFAPFGEPVPLPGFAVTAGISTPAVDAPYILPAGTTFPGEQRLPAAQFLAAPARLPAGTVIGPEGVALNVVLANVNPVVIPGNYELTEDVMLPETGLLVPEHAISLAMYGRTLTGPNRYSIQANLVNMGPVQAAPFDPTPGAAPQFTNMLYFPRSDGEVSTGGNVCSIDVCRRPAFITLNLNRPEDRAENRLVPVIVYHAPSGNRQASWSGMERSSYCQPLYQAYDWETHEWVNCNNAILGGDFNTLLDPDGDPFTRFTRSFETGGAGCRPPLINSAVDGDVAPADNPANKTYLSLCENPAIPTSPQIYNASSNAYLSSALDNVFARGFQAVEGFVYDLQNAVRLPVDGELAPPYKPYWMIPESIAAFLQVTSFRHYSAYMNGQLPVAPDLSPINSSPAFIQSLRDATFESVFPGVPNDYCARRAAEFVVLCVSDHLPLLIQAVL